MMEMKRSWAKTLLPLAGVALVCLVSAVPAYAGIIAATDFNSAVKSSGSQTMTGVVWTGDDLVAVTPVASITTVASANAGYFTSGFGATGFAPDQNIENEEPWAATIELVLNAGATGTIDSIAFDYAGLTNTGASQGSNFRPQNFDITVNGTVYETQKQTTSVNGSLLFSGSAALNTGTNLVVITSSEVDGPGYNMGIDNLSINGASLVGGGPPPPPAGTFTVSQPLNDWSTEIQPGTYTHALNFGNSTNSPTINTVPFVASQHGNFPGGNGNLSYIQSWNGTDGNNVINDGGLADEFLHSNTSGAALNLTGLTPGQEYLLKLFYVGWDASGDRTATFLDIDTGAQIVFDSEANGNNQGSVLSYQYIAQPDGQLNLSIEFARHNNAPHTYALTNQDVTAVIPEPATMALLSLAACGLGGYVRRRRKA